MLKMKVAILAGGFGTRLAEETTFKPKPMVEVGGIPVLWHLMESYARHGFREFVVALGYRGDTIKDYFVNYSHRSRSIEVDLRTGRIDFLADSKIDWKVTLLDTGLHTMTGGRVKQIAEFLGPQPFMLTYGDGLSDVDIPALLDFHAGHEQAVTLTAVRPPARFGDLELDGRMITSFAEKPASGTGWINGGFFVVDPGIENLIEDDTTIWERGPLEYLAATGNLAAFEHTGFWKCMDTLKDVQELQQTWDDGNAPWRW